MQKIYENKDYVLYFNVPKFTAQKYKEMIKLKQEVQSLYKFAKEDSKFSSILKRYSTKLKDIKDELKTTAGTITCVHKKTSFANVWHKQNKPNLESIVHYIANTKVALRKQRLSNREQNLHIKKIPLSNNSFLFEKRMVGLVNATPNQFYNAYAKKKAKDIFMEKIPMTQDKYLGIELEFCAKITKEQLALKILESGAGKFTHLKTDGSLRPKEGETAFEIALLIPEKNYKKDLKIICDVLRDIKAETENRRCGLHVHFDMRQRNKVVIYNNLVACQRALLELVPPNRRDNEFCRLVQSKKFPTKFTGSREERYKTINAAAFYRHKTIEVRMHQGTVDMNEISNWIDILVKIVNSRTKIKRFIKSVQSLKKKFRFNATINEYMTDRRNFWVLNRDSRLDQQIEAPTRAYQTVGNQLTYSTHSLEYALNTGETNNV